MLPLGLPSSFTGKHGHIRYTVKATLDLPWKFDEDRKLVFSVVTPVDLNLNTKAKEPVKQESEEQTLISCCCKSGLTLVVAIPHSGCVPGQSIPLTIEVDNCSNVQVTAVCCTLKKVLILKATNPKKKERTDKTSITSLCLGIDTNSSKSWTQHLTIPNNMPVYNLDQCNIIICKYFLKVVALVSGMLSNLSAIIPIFIGTVPFYQQPPVGGVTPMPTHAPCGSETPSPPGIAVPPPSTPTGGPDTAPVGFIVMPGPNANSMYPLNT